MRDDQSRDQRVARKWQTTNGTNPLIRKREMNQTLTTQEAANELGVHVNTVYRYIANGDLTAIRVGPKLLKINKTELERFMKGQVS
jgi:excisionase family DNA binding protein